MYCTRKHRALNDLRASHESALKSNLCQLMHSVRPAVAATATVLVCRYTIPKRRRRSLLCSRQWCILDVFFAFCSQTLWPKSRLVSVSVVVHAHMRPHNFVIASLCCVCVLEHHTYRPRRGNQESTMVLLSVTATACADLSQVFFGRILRHVYLCVCARTDFLHLYAVCRYVYLDINEMYI